MVAAFITVALLLTNMFDASTYVFSIMQRERDDTYFKEIEEDVLDECERFGKVERCVVDRNSDVC